MSKKRKYKSKPLIDPKFDRWISENAPEVYEGLMNCMRDYYLEEK